MQAKMLKLKLVFGFCLILASIIFVGKFVAESKGQGAESKGQIAKNVLVDVTTKSLK